jgi:myo-inositol-1(or 4)-monophosphatase
LWTAAQSYGPATHATSRFGPRPGALLDPAARGGQISGPPTKRREEEIMIRSALMNVMTGAAIKAGRGLKRDFGEIGALQVSMKGPGDFVSLADKRAEKTLFEELAKARPGYGFIMEESGRVEGSDKSHTWHIDPLDATTNFLHAIPLFAVSIALEREGQIVAGVIYNPATDEIYVTEKGQGAWGDNHRLRVAQRRELSQALVGCGVPHLGKAAHHPRFRAELAAVMAKVVNVRRMGCAALDLAYVAAGRFDAFWERGINSWDIAAGVLLIREAGGFVSGADGEENYLETGSVCAGNELMHRQLLALLKGA